MLAQRLAKSAGQGVVRRLSAGAAADRPFRVRCFSNLSSVDSRLQQQGSLSTRRALCALFVCSFWRSDLVVVVLFLLQVLGMQQIALGGLDKKPLSDLWVGMFGCKQVRCGVMYRGGWFIFFLFFFLNFG